MRDEMDARIWNEHHDQFSEWFEGIIASAGGLRLPRPRLAPQLVAPITAMTITLITFGGTV
jgi:hypothetical protein